MPTRHTPFTHSLIVFLLLALLFPGATPAQADGLSVGQQNAAQFRVYFIDVGQGDAALLRDPGGFDVLIDGGPPEAGARLVAFLRAQGVDSVEVMVATHADDDHTGGLAAVLQAGDIHVGALYYNGLAASGSAWLDVLAGASARGLTPVAAGYPDGFNWGTMIAQALSPAPELDDPYFNQQSLVLRVQYGAVRLLFSGDIDSVTEAALLGRGAPLEAEILKVAHHGSAGSSTEAFLAVVGAETAVISVGAGNDYGHPAAAALARLRAAGALVRRTDLEGTLLVESDGVTYTVSSARGRQVYLPLALSPQGAAPALPDIRIAAVFEDGSGSNEPDEYVELRSAQPSAVELAGWTLRDNSGRVFTFPSFSMQPGQVCRVYTNENHPEWCGFNYASGSAIWNNGGDCAVLRDGLGQEVAKRCY